jgi:NitT/TauT family transport system ATP-binding protein
LHLEHLEKSYHDQVVLKDVCLQLPEGEFLGLLGPSGCGKSTLLRLMAELEEPNGGKIYWRGDKNFAFVFQESELLPWRNAFENVRLPLELKSSLSPEAQDQKSKWALERVGLAKFANYFPHELSGGMKMRVSIARALSAGPKILFMDEPFSALDEVTRFDLQKQLRTLCEEEKLTVVFVTHSSFEAAFLADRVLLMAQKGGQFILNQKIAYPQRRDDFLRQEPAYLAQTHQISEKMRESFR